MRYAWNTLRFELLGSHHDTRLMASDISSSASMVCTKNQVRTTVGNTSFDDEIGLDFHNQLLHGPGIVRELDSRTTQPRKVVSPFMRSNFTHPNTQKAPVDSKSAPRFLIFCFHSLLKNCLIYSFKNFFPIG